MSGSILPRLPMDAHVEVRYGAAGEEFTGLTLDPLPSSVALAGPKLYPPGAELVLRFRRHGTQSDVITMKAVVRDCQATRMTVQLVNVKPSDHPRMMNMIFGLVAKRPAMRGAGA